jgi:hypothetical protein
MQKVGQAMYEQPAEPIPGDEKKSEEPSSDEPKETK